MKKVFLAIACIVFCLTKIQAQNDAILTVEETLVQISHNMQDDLVLTTERIQVVTDYQSQNRNDTILTIEQIQLAIGYQVHVCTNKYDRVLVYAPQGCTSFYWDNGEIIHDVNPFIFDGNVTNYYVCLFHGCGYHINFGIYFDDSNVPNETTEEFWKRQHEAITLEAVTADSANMYSYFWPHSGETTRTVEVTNQGNYQCFISDMCATATRTKIVNDNVEIDLATCDLESNLNLVTWQTNPAQAQYIDHVIVKRDGLQVGTADYSDGQFTDNIGSGSASRTYTLTAVATDGTECPVVSYPKETIHMAYLTGINNTIEVNWNVPAGYDLLGYNICEWHEDDGSLTVIDYVGASVTSYTCSESQFDEGYIVVQGVEAGKDGETRLLSNRSLDIIVGLGENEATAFKVYPNPANGVLFVETRRATSLPEETYCIVNPIGQTVMEGHITMEKQQINVRNLPKGVYFITVGGATRKFVVE